LHHPRASWWIEAVACTIGTTASSVEAAEGWESEKVVANPDKLMGVTEVTRE